MRVIVNGLAVRRSPFIDVGLVEELVFDPATGARVPSGDAVRLDAGHVVWVEIGPLVLDGVPWYQVHAGQQPGESPEAMVTWDSDGDGEGSDSGWIAGAGAGGSYLELGERPAGGPDPLVVASGVYDYTSESFRASFQVGGSYAFATRGLAPCHFRVTLQPTGEVLVDTALEGAFEQGEFDSSATDALADGEYTLEIQAGVVGSPEAECPWTLALNQNVG